jgi:hypothetical protein
MGTHGRCKPISRTDGDSFSILSVSKLCRAENPGGGAKNEINAEAFHVRRVKAMKGARMRGLRDSLGSFVVLSSPCPKPRGRKVTFSSSSVRPDDSARLVSCGRSNTRAAAGSSDANRNRGCDSERNRDGSVIVWLQYFFR